jgi:hypothetical protein
MMTHLTLETLARLIDEAPDPTENGHLDICESCRTELEALRADAAALHALPDPEPPIAAWLALEQRLGREGLIRKRNWTRTLMQMAAVLAMFVLGSVVGGTFVSRRSAQVATGTQPAAPAASAQMAGQPLINDTPRSAAVMTSAPITAAAPATVRPAATAEEAVARLRDAETAYLAALNRFSDFNGRTESTDPLARLAALESIVATTRAALGQAPADPVINGYHLTAVAQRDATLRQLAATGQTWY